VEIVITVERVHQGLFESAWGPNRNAHILDPKENEQYCFIISAMSGNWHNLEDTGQPTNDGEFSEAFAS